MLIGAESNAGAEFRSQIHEGRGRIRAASGLLRSGPAAYRGQGKSFHLGWVLTLAAPDTVRLRIAFFGPAARHVRVRRGKSGPGSACAGGHRTTIELCGIGIR